MKNTNLKTIDKTSRDCFSAGYQDVATEISNYKTYLKDKKIYCPCDHPESSIWKYFTDNFSEINPYSVRSTYFSPNSKGQVSLLIDGATIEFDLQGDGSFTSKPCQDLMQLDNVIISQPPLSKVEQFIKNMIENNKKFLVVCPFLVLKNKYIFSLIKNSQIWVGQRVQVTNKKNNKSKSNVINCFWISNIENKSENEPLFLEKDYYGNEDKYPRFDNISAISVDKLKNIPKDYYDVMAVPVTYLTKICNKQFEILGMTSTVPFTKKYENLYRYMKDGRVIKDCASDGFIQVSDKPDGTYYKADNTDNYLVKSFTKILIKRM